MLPARLAAHRVTPAILWTVVVMLLGVAVLGYGYFAGRPIAFYNGLFITIAGVLSGALQLTVFARH